MAEKNKIPVSELNIYQRLAKIRKQVEVMQKDKQAYGYKYVDEASLMAKISVFMEKYELSLIPMIEPGTPSVEPYHTEKTKVSKQGEVYTEHVNEILTSAEMTFRWICNDKPEQHLDVPWVLIGHQGDASQSFGSGLSYCIRYFLLKFFNVATPNDDPDHWRSQQKQAEKDEDKMIAESVIQSLDESVRDFLSKNPKRKDEVKEFMNNYIAGGAYTKIRSSKTASQLLTDFLEKFN